MAIKQAPARARAVRQAADRAGRRHRAGVDRDDRQRLGGADRRAPEAEGADRGGQGCRAARPASTSSTARPRPRSRPPSRPSACSVLNEELLAVPDGFTVHPKLVKQLEQRREALGRPDEPAILLGARRGARVRVAADRGNPDPAHRPGHRARHLQPAPPRAARPEDRPGALRDPAPAGRARADGAAQLAAVGDGLRSASSTATRRRRPRRSSCGRRSSATSPTARR